MTVDLQDPTKNQHFLSQIEQRLNAIDPTVASDKQRIYCFEVLRRSPVQLSGPADVVIGNNLSMLDLFSFDVDKRQPLRHNFEALFNRYESNVNMQTEGLLDKVAAGDLNVLPEIRQLHATKLLNFVRNPFSVEKILNTFGELGNYMPLRPDVLRLFRKILTGRRPHQKYLCDKLGIDNAKYAQWLRMLFNLLTELEPGAPPLLEQIVSTLFDAQDFALAVLISTYSSPQCLLSDRGFSTNTEGSDMQSGFDFNLSSKAFIRYLSVSMQTYDSAAKALQVNSESYPKPIVIRHEHDDLDLLRDFNRLVVEQCHRNVYCALDRSMLL